MIDQQSQQRINEAAEQFTDALVQSYKVVAERGASAQEQGAQVTEVFFNQAINNLRAQAEENRQASDQLAEQQQRQANAARTLTKESVDAYMYFMDSMFSWWQGGVQSAARGTGPGAPTGGGGTSADRSREAELPLENYDSLSASEVNGRIERLSDEEIGRLRDYEARNKNRRTVIERMDARLSAATHA